ncbi:MAG TPA: hypothetical protein PLI18_09000, partial [Pirellulaceae bacterium]|nr:hypothetical protein [Pirellulaceae bacterium]
MASTSSESSGFSLGRVLVIILPVLLIAGGVVGFVYMNNSSAANAVYDLSELVPVKAKVTFRGEPLPNATVLTYLEDGRPGGIGATDAEGMIQLMTDVGGGKIGDGVLPGKHKLTVVASLPGMGAMPGPAFTPTKYRTRGDSPLEIEAKAGAAEVELVVEDDDTAMTAEAIAEYLSRASGAGDNMKKMAEQMEAGRGSGGPRSGGGGGRQRPEGESDAPSGDAPSGDAPSGDAPSGDAPSGDAPSGDAPSGDAPSGDAPSGDAPNGDAPNGDAPNGDAPNGDA